MELISQAELPEDWDIAPIANFVDHYRGGAPLKPSDFVGAGFNVIPKKAIVPGGYLRIIEGDETLCKETFAQNHQKSIIDSRYLVTTLRDLVPTGPSIGYIVKFDGDQKYLLAQGVYGFLLKAGLDKDYLIQLSNAQMYRRTMQRIMVGSTQVHIRTGDYFDTEIPVPPFAEQRRIAEVLVAWDKAITLTEQLIAAKQKRKKALMQQLLTGRRQFKEFVGCNKKRETRFGEIPFDWKIVHIQDAAKVNVDTLGNKSDPDCKYLYIDLSSVNHGTITFPEERQKFADLPSRARRVLHRGDVIMATVRPNLLGFAVCDFEPQDVLCSTGFAIISPKNPSDSEFIYQSLYSVMMLRQIRALVTGSNYPAINASEVKKLRLLWPKSIEERKKIGMVLRACDTEIDLLARKLATLQRQKKGLMQQLLTGRVRVVPPSSPPRREGS